jgi:hypothetical protein
MAASRDPTNPFADETASIATVSSSLNQSTGRLTELVIGNGTVTTHYLTDLLVQAQSEVLFSTCFWAVSPSLSLLHDALIALNGRGIRNGRRIAVRIMFSSYSFRQKFLSFSGTRIWKSNTWTKLGLPAASKLENLDITVFSRFKKPFGVMHAKFLIIDRAVVVMPSSNISCKSPSIFLPQGKTGMRWQSDWKATLLNPFFHTFITITTLPGPPCLHVQSRPILSPCHPPSGTNTQP